jgi:hypothetical protein
MPLLDALARLGFSLFITGGFATGLCLFAGMTSDSPKFVGACGSFFLWTLALISCGMGRHS